MSDEATIARVVAAVLERMKAGDVAPAKGLVEGRECGIFATVDQAVEAASRAQRAVTGLPLETRRHMLANIRRRCAEQVQLLSQLAVDETGMGRVDDKVAKNLLAIHKTPGIELLQSQSYTGDHGLTLVERAPYGVIGAITPSTNPTETLINNAIGMLAAGNAVVFNPHPMARRTSMVCIDIINRAVVEVGGPDNLVTAVREPSIDTAQAVMSHPGVRLVVVTGGGGVVKAAMSSGKKCIAAGPGNPPVVVGPTADIEQAGVGIVRGASFDNNVICVDEKEVFVVASVADALLDVMGANGAVRLTARQTDQLHRLLFTDGAMDRSWVGRSASAFLKAIDMPVQGDPRLLVAEVGEQHDFVQREMLMPVLGVVRVPDVPTGIEQAIAAEHGYGHTASMYSRDLDALHAMARAFDGSIFVKNAPHYAGVGFGGEGYTSWTIASPTGEGLTTCLDFSRVRRCTLAGYFRIV